MNICLLQGTTVGEIRVKELQSGQWALSFDVRTATNSPSRSVPVEWTGPKKLIPKVGSDQSIAVIGRLDRRFYRVGASTQTHVFVRPEKIIVRQAKRQDAQISAALEAALDSVGAPGSAGATRSKNP